MRAEIRIEHRMLHRGVHVPVAVQIGSQPRDGAVHVPPDLAGIAVACPETDLIQFAFEKRDFVPGVVHGSDGHIRRTRPLENEIRMPVVHHFPIHHQGDALARYGIRQRQMSPAMRAQSQGGRQGDSGHLRAHTEVHTIRADIAQPEILGRGLAHAYQPVVQYHRMRAVVGAHPALEGGFGEIEGGAALAEEEHVVFAIELQGIARIQRWTRGTDQFQLKQHGSARLVAQQQPGLLGRARVARIEHHRKLHGFGGLDALRTVAPVQIPIGRVGTGEFHFDIQIERRAVPNPEIPREAVAHLQIAERYARELHLLMVAKAPLQRVAWIVHNGIGADVHAERYFQIRIGDIGPPGEIRPTEQQHGHQAQKQRDAALLDVLACAITTRTSRHQQAAVAAQHVVHAIDTHDIERPVGIAPLQALQGVYRRFAMRGGNDDGLQRREKRGGQLFLGDAPTSVRQRTLLVHLPHAGHRGGQLPAFASVDPLRERTGDAHGRGQTERLADNRGRRFVDGKEVATFRDAHIQHARHQALGQELRATQLQHGVAALRAEHVSDMHLAVAALRRQNIHQQHATTVHSVRIVVLHHHQRHRLRPLPEGRPPSIGILGDGRGAVAMALKYGQPGLEAFVGRGRRAEHPRPLGFADTRAGIAAQFQQGMQFAQRGHETVGERGLHHRLLAGGLEQRKTRTPGLFAREQQEFETRAPMRGRYRTQVRQTHQIQKLRGQEQNIPLQPGGRQPLHMGVKIRDENEAFLRRSTMRKCAVQGACGRVQIGRVPNIRVGPPFLGRHQHASPLFAGIHARTCGRTASMVSRRPRSSVRCRYSPSRFRRRRFYPARNSVRYRRNAQCAARCLPAR